MQGTRGRCRDTGSYIRRAYMQEFIEVDRTRAVEVSHAEHTLQLQHVVPLARLLGK